MPQEFKGTPGEWEVGYQQTGVRWPVVIVQTDDPDEPEIVCDIEQHFDIDAAEDDPMRVEAEANARIMAKAKVLFAALAELLEAEEAKYPAAELGAQAQRDWCSRQTKARAAARAALAAATGEAK